MVAVGTCWHAHAVLQIIIISVERIVSTLLATSIRVDRVLEEAREYVTARRIPPELAARLLRHYDHYVEVKSLFREQVRVW